MTATITPPAGVLALQRVDPGDRLTDYDARRVLPRSPDDGSGPGGLRGEFRQRSQPARAPGGARRAGKDVEPPLLRRPRLSGRTQGARWGDPAHRHALERSRLLGALPADEPFWKVTGRLRFTNIDRLIATAPSGPELYIDEALSAPLGRHPHSLRTPRTFRELFTAREPLMRQNELERSGYSAPEERLFEELLPLRERARVAPRLRLEPRVEGYSGHGHDYARVPRVASGPPGAESLRRLCLPLWIRLRASGCCSSCPLRQRAGARHGGALASPAS